MAFRIFFTSKTQHPHLYTIAFGHQEFGAVDGAVQLTHVPRLMQPAADKTQEQPHPTVRHEGSSLQDPDQTRSIGAAF